MFQEKEEDLHVLQFGSDCQKMGGETVVQRFSSTVQSVVQAEHGVIGRSCWAVPSVWPHTEHLHLPLNTTLSTPEGCRDTNPIVCRCRTVVPTCSARLKSGYPPLQEGKSH